MAGDDLTRGRRDADGRRVTDVADVITSGRMPPMSAPEGLAVTPPERAVVSEWRRCGYER